MTLLPLSISCLSNSAHYRSVDSHEWGPGWRDPEDRMEFATVPNWRKQAIDEMRRSIPITAYGPSFRHAHLGAMDQLRGKGEKSQVELQRTHCDRSKSGACSMGKGQARCPDRRTAAWVVVENISIMH